MPYALLSPDCFFRAWVLNCKSRMRRYLEAALIVVVMLCVPALTRASQRLDLIGAVPQASGLSRNCDTPPERIQPPVAAFPSVAAPDAVAGPAVVPEHRIADPVTDAEPVPTPSIVSPPDSLRAPPRSRA